MKKIIPFFFLLIISATSFSLQTSTSKATLTKADYLKKSKNQKTAAWVLTGAGTAGLFVSLLADASQETSSALISLFSLGTVEPPEYKSYTVPYLLSVASVIGGVTLFIASSRSKKKAMNASVYFKVETVPVIQQTSFASRPYPALVVKINL